MAKPKKKGGTKQYLTPKARKDKAKRDLAIAMTPARKKKRRENQQKRRDAEKKGINLTGLDWNHKTGRFESVKANRGNHGKGTKRENKNSRGK